MSRRFRLGRLEVELRRVPTEVVECAPSRSAPLTEDIELLEAAIGVFAVLTKDIGISKDIRTRGIWAVRDVRLFRSLIGAGDRVIDVGANLGHHTVLFSGLVGPEGRVLAIEPQALMFHLLEANLLLNRCANVVAERCAVGEERGVVKMWPVDYSTQNNFGALGISRHEGQVVLEHAGETVPTCRLDDLVRQFDWQGVDFLKIDAQTYELYVLLGAEEVLGLARPILFVEVSPYWMRRTGYDYREIYGLLQRMDYRIFEPHLSLNDEAPIREWSGDEGQEWDLLAVPRERRGSFPWRRDKRRPVRPFQRQ